MTSPLCRICLQIGSALEGLTGYLLVYYQDLCDTSGISKLQCCSVCKESLKNNLKFRNKCVISNRILKEWEDNNTEENKSVHSLHTRLQTYLTNAEVEDLEYKTNKQNRDHFDEVKSEIETIKEESKTSGFEVIDCDTNLILNNQENCIKGEKPNDWNGINDNYSDDDDKYLIDCVSKDKKSYIKKVKNKNGTAKTNLKKVKKREKRVYTRKGLTEYAEYGSVFDIELFNTDDEARTELAQRRLAEPYASARYKCEICFTVYKCEKLLKFHMKWHDGSSGFECDICRMRFATRKALQCHKTKCHRGKFACKLCPLITYYGSAMKAHFEKHQGKTFKCHCDRVFNHISSYLTHKRTVHASAHVCVSCARTFVSELGLLNHRLRAHQSKSLVDGGGTTRCEPCELTFANQQVYTVHLLNTSAHKDIANDMIACSYCGLSFEDVPALKTHKRQLHPKRKDVHDLITCKLCGASGRGRVWRRRHYAVSHPHVRYLEDVCEGTPHMCDQCGKRFSNISLMKDHLNSHLGIKPYACAECGATFSSAACRSTHLERHAPPTRACVHCGRRFRTASNLAVHMRIHIGIRRHECDVCSKAFLHRAALREHIRGVHRNLRRARNSTLVL